MAWFSEYECDCGGRHRVSVDQKDAPDLRVIEYDCPVQRHRVATLTSGVWYDGGDMPDAVHAMIRG